jgi:hypothetical protein
MNSLFADNPKQDGFSAACYHKDLEPFMARGRVLREEKNRNKRSLLSVKQMKSGQLK